jgi:ADP-heptose:LPS heptosyltransferase
VTTSQDIAGHRRHVAFLDQPSIFRPLGAYVAGVERIAVLRASPVGDFIEALPALAALRRTYPCAHIVLLGKSWQAEFFARRPSPIDEVVVLPSIPGIGIEEGGGGDNAEVDRFIAAMQSRRFDLVLQLHGGGRHSNPFVRRLGARLTVGMSAPGAPALDRSMIYHVMHPEVLRLLQAVSLVGAVAPVGIEPMLTVTAHDRAQADAVLAPDDRPLVMLQPGARDARRQWAPQYFAAVGDAMASMGAVVAINGTADEAPITAAVAQHMRYRASDLAGRLALNGLAGLAARARLVISNDTGVAHLARAVGTPTVTIYWIGNLCTHGPLNAANHRVAISWRTQCPSCGISCIDTHCGHQASFVDDVTTEEVVALARELYEAPAIPEAPPPLR